MEYSLQNLKTAATVVAVVFCLGNEALAQSSADETARELANPNTALASLTFKNIYTAYTGNLQGADSESGFTTLFQPSLPFPLENGDKIIFRPALPIIVDAPVFDAANLDFDSESGIGDTGFDLIYATTSESGFLTGYGIVGTLPTASEEVLGKDKWAFGPEIFFGQITQSSVIGALINHQWDVGDSDDVVEDVNQTTINFFGVYLPGGGWNVGSSPIISYDWESEDWTLPLI